MTQRRGSEREAGSPLVELSNAMVALHRENFGRGPAAARAFVNEDVAVCLLTDIYTRVERTLIEAGRQEHVRATRLLYQQALEDRYKAAAEAALGRRVSVYLSVVSSEPDVAVEVFLLGEQLDPGDRDDGGEEEDLG